MPWLAPFDLKESRGRTLADPSPACAAKLGGWAAQAKCCHARIGDKAAVG